MCDKIPFFTFFESFVPPRDLGLLLHDACVVGGSMDREIGRASCRERV